MSPKWIIILTICLWVFIIPVCAVDNTTSVSIDGNCFISIPTDSIVSYTQSTQIPSNGALVLSDFYNDTYMIQTETSTEFVTVSKLKPVSIVDQILGWLNL